MNVNPYKSPKATPGEAAERADDDAIHLRLVRGILRGALVGALFGTVGGVAILLVLGLWIQTPVLTGDATTATKVSLMFIAFAVMSTTSVGAIGFGMASIRLGRRGDGSRRR